MTRISGYDALHYAEEQGLLLNKYADPTEDAREGLDIYEAREVASEDASLLYLDTEPLRVASVVEAAVLTEHFLHCGSVRDGDEWDTEDAWTDSEIRLHARRLLIQYREHGTLPTESERRMLAVCCGD